MWNRRDLLTLSAAAVATFGFTVGLFMPRPANAVNDQPVATAEVKVPTLAVGDVQVTAALDPANPHTVLLTMRNTSNDATSAQFTARADVRPPVSQFSRGRSPGQEVWKEEYSMSLKQGETRTVPVELPAAVFATQQTQTPVDPKTMVPGGAYLSLLQTNGTGITALTLWTGKVDNPAITAALAVPALAPAAPAAPAKGTP